MQVNLSAEEKEVLFSSKGFVRVPKKGTDNNLLKSAYLIIRKSELKNNPLLVNDIVDGFKELYPYFD